MDEKLKEAENYYYSYINSVLKEYKNIFTTEDERQGFKEFFIEYLNKCSNHEYNHFVEINELSLKLKEALNEFNCCPKYKEIIFNIIDQSIYDKNSIVVLKSTLNKYKNKVEKLEEEIKTNEDLLKSQNNNFDLNKYKQLCKEYKNMSNDRYLRKLDSNDFKLVDALDLSSKDI